MATETTAADPELKTYWCHECDMSVALTLSPSPTPSPLLCPHCHTHFLELMDSPFPQNDAAPFPSFLFDSPFLHRLIHHHHHNENDVVEDDLHFEDPLALLTSKTASSKTSLPVIAVTSSLLSQLDPNGVVFCAVCKDQIAVDAEAKQLPCNHLYHSDCITPWLAHHDSCPLCRFRLAAEEEEDDDDEEEEDGDDDDDEDGASSRAREIRRQLRAAMVRLSELMEEEEEEDFYGLRTTLNHIASRHGLLDDSNGSRVSEENRNLTTEVGSPIDGGGDGQQTGVTG